MNNSQVNEKKTVSKTYLEEMGLDIATQIKNSSLNKGKDIKCWEYYNEFENNSDFDYLRKFGNDPNNTFILPAKVRHIGIQRPKINNMAGTKAQRPFVFSVFVADELSKKQKLDKKLKLYFKKIEQKIKERKYTIEDSLQELQMQRQNIQNKVQYMQQALEQSQDPKEQMQLQLQLQDLGVMMPRIESQMQRIENEFLEQEIFTDQEIQNIELKLKSDFKDTKEIIGQKILIGLRRLLGIERKSTQAFIDKTVSGKEYFYVDYIPGERLPRFEQINDVKVYYPNDPDAEYTHQGRWVAIESEYSYEALIRNWGGMLSPTAKKELEEIRSTYGYNDNTYNFISGTGNKAVDNPYAGTQVETTGNGINVKQIWFRVERPVYMKFSPNKFTGDFYRKVITDDDLRKDPIQTKKGEKKETRYIDDVYQAVVIHNKHVVDVKLKPYQYRNPDNPSFVPLPIVGKTFNSITDRPYSLIWSTRHLQDQYKILTFQKELLIALSGVKGQIIDLSQKPRGMSKEEHAYYKKLGRLYIETVGPDGRPKNISYNQWKDYDDTLSPGIQIIDQMLQQIDMTCTYTMGLTPQSMGAMSSGDLVGTTEIARDQASLTTAILYHEHDEIERIACELLINIAIQQCFSDEFIMTILDNKLGAEDVSIPKGLFKNVAFELGLINALQDERNLRELKMLSIKQNDKGMLPFSQLVSIYNTESVKELEKKLEYFSKMAEDIQAKNMQAQGQQALEVEKAKIQFAKEYEAEIAKQRFAIDEQKNKILEGQLQIQAAQLEMQQKTEAAKLAQEKQLKMLDIGAEREIEAAYLQEQNRAARMQEQLQAIKLQMDSITESLNASLQDKDLIIDKQKADDKNATEIKKAKSVKKERNRV